MHREMRNQSGDILRHVAAGETIQVTNHGQVAALIVPPGTDPLADLVSRGQVRVASELAGRDDRKLISSWSLHTEMHCAVRRHPDDVDLEAVRTVLDSVSLLDLTREDLLALGMSVLSPEAG